MRYSSKAVLLKFRASGQLRERGKNTKAQALSCNELGSLLLLGSSHIGLQLFHQSHPASSSSELCTLFFPLLECLTTFLIPGIGFSLPVIHPWVTILAFHNTRYLHNCLCGICLLHWTVSPVRAGHQCSERCLTHC